MNTSVLAQSARFDPCRNREQPKHGALEAEAERDAGFPPPPIEPSPTPYKGPSAAIRRGLKQKEKKRQYDMAYRARKKAEAKQAPPPTSA